MYVDGSSAEGGSAKESILFLKVLLLVFLEILPLSYFQCGPNYAGDLTTLDLHPESYL